MTGRDRFLAALCVILWGLQFVVTHIALRDVGPLLLVALRFAPVAVITVLFVPRPRVRWRWLFGYGLFLGTLEFALLFLALSAGLPSGLAALILQSSAPFTVLLGVLFGQRPGRRVLGGLALCVAGLTAVGVLEGQRAALGPVLLAVAAGFSWAVGNLCGARAGADSAFRFSLWMTVVPPIPMFLAAWLIEGADRTTAGLRVLLTPDGMPVWLCLLYLSALSTVVGTGIWTVLLARYPSHQVAPLSTLVPVIGLAAGAIILREPMSPGVLGAGVLVLTGLGLITARSRARVEVGSNPLEERRAVS